MSTTLSRLAASWSSWARSALAHASPLPSGSSDALTLAAAAVLTFQLAPILASITYYVFWRLALRKPPRSYGKWAVVTGASDGIGLAYARELARAGVCVALVARSADKLAAAKASVEAARASAAVEVVTVQADFSDTGCYAKVRSALLRNIAPDDVGLLVNCVGVSSPAALYFDPRESDRAAPGLRTSLVNVNVVAATEMTELFLPYMLEKRKGIVVNVGSGFGLVPSPLYAQYGATKAYLEHLSRSLSLELRGSGVHVQCQAPMVVCTAMSGMRKPSLFTPTPEDYARAAVRDLGSGTNTVPYWPHYLLSLLAKVLPRAFVEWQLVSGHRALRERFVQKTRRRAEEAERRAMEAGDAPAAAAAAAKAVPAAKAAAKAAPEAGADVPAAGGGRAGRAPAQAARRRVSTSRKA
jgi:17beta-estradiol 17-dehydrogenase / very-long-chain 3-oxoacyl-CoA reductase